MLERVGDVAYHLALPPHLSRVYNVFHVLILRKYEPTEGHVLKWLELQLDEIVSYKEQPIQILEANEHVLRGRTISLVRVLWQHHGATETMWENESKMRR